MTISMQFAFTSLSFPFLPTTPHTQKTLYPLPSTSYSTQPHPTSHPNLSPLIWPCGLIGSIIWSGVFKVNKFKQLLLNPQRAQPHELQVDASQKAGMNIKLSGTASQIMLMAIIVSIVVLMVGIGVLVIVHACITRRAHPRALIAIIRESCSNGIKKLSPDDLEKLPSFEYKASTKGSGPVDCVVCLESFQKDDRCRLLPACKHSFHAHCIDSWLLKSPVCPICRASVVLEEQRSYQNTGIGVGERHSIVVGLPANAALPDFGASSSA